MLNEEDIEGNYANKTWDKRILVDVSGRCDIACGYACGAAL
jgi:hypothetical protein